ncbi:YhgE/Pip domain-containing protein [Tessaracoccus sp. MC1865]|uniref:YhgE/Pip domain-containing protein n=1 Tax=Tessaracoccus sp. MC1865 TaxID=2760310 RepID=UPI0015FFE9E6|nr:YhgE/Pip domain-containing protein [Tessaracoccus sp. MC1865]MBB1482979.1 YhgE/Pip domain-containing protein [Tessaracoccus sp. MC1865]QTO37584.1 YhgE/Pip domain-containing protein [Tessaracoccus sp. MC1865]
MRNTRPTPAQIVAMALVPLLAAGLMLGLIGRGGESRIEAAVVNLDQAVTVGDQYIPMGRQLTAAMVEREGDNISWTLADAPSATEGLRSGRFSAVVTIPENFSANATSWSENDAAKAEQAGIQVAVSDNAPVTDAQVAEQIARMATDTINAQLTEGYLDGIYVGFNTVGEQFGTIVDGVSELEDGASQLSDGAQQSADGAAQLNDGMTLLKDNGGKLADGGAQLAEGVGDLAVGVGALNTGAGQLASGADQLADGVDQFAGQAPRLVDGAEQLADGVEQFSGQTPALVDGVTQLADQGGQLLAGLPEFAEGSAAVVGGVDQLSDGLNQIITGIENQPVDTSELDLLAQGARATADGAAGLSGGLTQADQALQGYASGAVPMPAEVAAVADQIAQAFTCPVEDPATCEMRRQTFAAGAAAGVQGGFQAGTGAGSAALNTPDPQSGLSLLGGAGQLAGGADALADGVDTLVAELPTQTAEQMAVLSGALTQVRDGAEQIVIEAQPIVDNAPLVSDGATRLAGGLQQLKSQVGALPAGVTQLADGARSLADGIAQLPAGVQQLQTGARGLADGASGLAGGVGQLDSGAQQLQTGAEEYVSGVGQYTAGVRSAAEGTDALSGGLSQLSSGAGQLSDGLELFNTELTKGAEELPAYSAEDRKQLSSVAASPVAEEKDLITPTEVGSTALLIVAGLWLGALAAFAFWRPVPRNVVSSRAASIVLWGRTVWLPLVLVVGQGLVLGLVGSVVLGLGVGTAAVLVLLMMLLGGSFALANHALAGWLGNIGRLISGLLLVVTVGLGLSSAVGWLSPIGAVSPLQNGFELVRTHMADGTGEVGLASVALLLGVVALTFSVTAIAAKRRLTPAQFRAAHAG